MSIQVEKRTARLNCRVSAKVKQRTEEAAAMTGQSITGFTEAALSTKAESILLERDKLIMSDRDFERFLSAIQKAPAPTNALRGAAAEYKSLRRDDPTCNW